MRILILDDDQTRHDALSRVTVGHDVWHAHDAWRACQLLDGPRFDLCLLDHDLGPEHGNNGWRVANHIAVMPASMRPSRVIVHSWNIGRGTEMAQKINSADVWVRRIVFGDGLLEAVKALCEAER